MIFIHTRMDDIVNRRDDITRTGRTQRRVRRVYIYTIYDNADACTLYNFLLEAKSMEKQYNIMRSLLRRREYGPNRFDNEVG